MVLFVGSLGNFAFKAIVGGLSIFTTSYMPNKLADSVFFFFFRYSSDRAPGRARPGSYQRLLGSVRVSSFGGASLKERQLPIGVFTTACRKDQYIATASMDVCLVLKQKRRFSFSATVSRSQQLPTLVGVALEVFQVPLALWQGWLQVSSTAFGRHDFSPGMRHS